MRLVKGTNEREALSVDGIPGGELIMAFPVRDVSAAPFIAATGDAGMFSDLADLHLERCGLRGGEDAGSLTDCFTLRKEEEEALLLPVLLAQPEEGELPRKSPKGFDISARCLPMPASATILWREFGRWVFAITDRSGQMVYFQALPGAMIDEQLAREIKLGIAQLAMQGILVESPEHLIVWSEEGEIPPAPEAVEGVAAFLGAQGTLSRKPSPVLPSALSSLLPADVRAERVAKQKARQVQIGIAAALVAYLAGIGFLGYQYMQEKKVVAALEAKLANSSPEALAVQEHMAKWGELEPLVENEYYPIEMFFNAYQAAPKEGLKILRAEMNNQYQVQSGGQMLRRNIQLTGESVQASQAVVFGENLQRSNYFDGFNKDIPSPNPTNNDRWSFNYTATQ